MSGATKLLTPGGGGVLLTPASSIAADVTVNLPTAVNGATLAIDGPAFAVYANGGQAISANTWTKVQFNTELFDTNNCFDNATNYRFTPNVAGYYQINIIAGVNNGSSNNSIATGIYKNGTLYLENSHDMSTGNYQWCEVSDVIYCNGTTDYIEAYVITTYAANVLTGSSLTRFSGAMVRGA